MSSGPCHYQTRYIFINGPKLIAKPDGPNNPSPCLICLVVLLSLLKTGNDSAKSSCQIEKNKQLLALKDRANLHQSFPGFLLAPHTPAGNHRFIPESKVRSAGFGFQRANERKIPIVLLKVESIADNKDVRKLKSSIRNRHIDDSGDSPVE